MESELQEQVEKTYYTPAVKRAIMKHRERNKEKYNEAQLQYYHLKKQDEEWKRKFTERCRKANEKFRQKQKEEREKLNIPPKKRGRPRKIQEIEEIEEKMEEIKLNDI